MHVISMSGITFREYLTRYEGEGPDAWYTTLDMETIQAEYHEAVAVTSSYTRARTRTQDGLKPLWKPPHAIRSGSNKISREPSMDTALPTNYAHEPGRRERAQIGYASYSKREGRAALDAQLAELGCSGCQNTKCEEVESASERKVLERLLRHLKGGEVLTVTKLDRLARSAQEATDIIQVLHSRGVTLRILNLDLDTGTLTGKQLLQFLAAAAEVERTALLDRRYEDKQRMIDYLSHKINIRVLALENLARVDALRSEGVEREQMARRLGLSETVVGHAHDELIGREKFDHPKLEKELSKLRERLAATMREDG